MARSFTCCLNLLVCIAQDLKELNTQLSLVVERHMKLLKNNLTSTKLHVFSPCWTSLNKMCLNIYIRDGFKCQLHLLMAWVFFGLVWTFKLSPSKHTQTRTCMPGHSPVHFRDQQGFLRKIKVKCMSITNVLMWFTVSKLRMCNTYNTQYFSLHLYLLPDNSLTERLISIVNVTLSVQNRIEHPT